MGEASPSPSALRAQATPSPARGVGPRTPVRFALVSCLVLANGVFCRHPCRVAPGFTGAASAAAPVNPLAPKGALPVSWLP